MIGLLVYTCLDFDITITSTDSALFLSRFQSATEDLILRAFQTLDSDRKGEYLTDIANIHQQHLIHLPIFHLTGYLTKRELESSLTGSGEPFSSDEFEEMWTAIKALRFPSDSDRTLPSDAFDYSLYTKYMMK